MVAVCCPAELAPIIGKVAALATEGEVVEIARPANRSRHDVLYMIRAFCSAVLAPPLVDSDDRFADGRGDVVG
jgi:hypothetical protein